MSLSLKLLPEAASASQSFGPRETTAALVQDAGAARHAIPASTVQHRQTLEQEILRSDTLAGELAAARSELGTKVALANKAVDEAAQIRRAAEATTAELQKSLHQERERIRRIGEGADESPHRLGDDGGTVDQVA